MSILTFDSFYFGLTPEEHELASEYDFDSPNALDLDKAYESIKQLLAYEDAHVPVYDFVEHHRIPG